MYFPFHRSKMGQESDDDGVPISPNFPTSSGSTDKCDELAVEGKSSKKPKIDSDNLKLVPAKFQDHPTCESKKSPLPYIGMIAEAINSSPDKKMVLSEIYTYMEQHFFQYLSGKPRWRNTVRHNLSFHRCFVKCECSRRGNRSHFWSIHPEYIEQFKRGNFTKTLSPPREQINSSHYRPEQQIFRRNPSENFHRFFTNSSCENYLHYEGVPPTSPNTFFQVISPSGSTSLHPHHDLRSFPLVQSSSSRGIFSRITGPFAGHDATQRLLQTDPPSYQYTRLFPIPWQYQHLPVTARANEEVYSVSRCQTSPSTPNMNN